MADAKERAAIGSIVASSGIAGLKLVVALATGSLALLTDALHSLMDVAATVMTWLAVRYAAKPADSEHHYGHGKVESVSALIEVGLLVAVSAFVVVEASARLIGRSEAEVAFSWAAIAVLVVAIVVDFLRVRALRRIARETQSHALESNALHFSADMWQSAVVLIGLGFVYLGYPQADSIAALAVAGFIVVAAWGLGKRTFDTLMDMAPEGVAERIGSLASTQRGVVAVERVRARRVGATIFAEVSVAVPRLLAPDRIAALKEALGARIREELPDVEATITANPRALDDESVLERVLLIAAAKRIPVHHVTVQQIEGKLAVALDLEVDGRLSLEAAHVIATRLETAIRDAFGPETEVETHIEPLEARGIDGEGVPEAERAATAATIAGLAEGHPTLGDIHDVRVRRTPKGRLVVLHCRADPKTTVAEVHAAVDALEHAIRGACPDVVRVVTHAEPRK